MNGPETGEYPNRPETLTTGQPAIKGYRNLTALEVDLMNAIKASGEDLGQLIEVVQQHLGRQNIAAMASSDPDEAKRIDNAQPARWVAMARTDFQTGLMKLTRAVAQPTTF